MANLPENLNNRPLFEALFEIRFTSQMSAMTANILAAALYGDESLRAKFPNQGRLPPSFVPDEIRDNDPNMKYAADLSFSSDIGTINVGRNALVVALNHNYDGWDDFKQLVELALSVVSGTNVVHSVERFSLKYTNFIPHESEQRVIPEVLDMQLKIADNDLMSGPFDIKTELESDGIISLIQVTTNAEIGLKDYGQFSGSLFVLDCIQANIEEGFVSNPSAQLDIVHNELRRRFTELASQGMFEKFEGLKDEFKC